MEINGEVKSAIEIALKKLTTEPAKISLSRTIDDRFGDLTTNVAMSLAPSLRMPPMELAKQIVDALPSVALVEKVEIASPGYINITLSKKYWLQCLKQISVDENYGSHKGLGKTILIEYGQPNTHKLPHIGHLYSYVYGESCARLLKANGNIVKRANYQGDVGLHVAKCLWALPQMSKFKEADEMLLDAKVDLLQAAYQLGSGEYEENAAAKSAIDALTGKIYARNAEIEELWRQTRQWSLDYYQKFEARLGIEYDRSYLESETAKVGLETVESHVGDVFEKDAGAVVFRGEEFGLHTRVFVNSLGNPTYEAKDVGLMTLKLKDFDFDTSVVTTASEQNEYWRVLIQVLELLYPQTKNRLKHIGFGLIHLTNGKMSSRSGNIITAMSLVEMVKSRILEITEAAGRAESAEEIDSIAETLALGAVKYSFLKSTAGKDITFDLETSIQHEGNSGPYLQYTYARCQSVLEKAGDIEMEERPVQINEAELSLLRQLPQLPELVRQAAEEYAPHLICNYLYSLATRFSRFYNEYQIAGDDKSTTAFRVALTRATARALKNGLELLGIDVVDRI